jgi:hypothetical protein
MWGSHGQIFIERHKCRQLERFYFILFYEMGHGAEGACIVTQMKMYQTR